MSYPSDLTDEQWMLLGPVFNAPGKRGRTRGRRARRGNALVVVIDTHLARGASNGGFTFHDRGGPYGRTKGAKRVVAVDVTGLPVGALVVPASTHENRASELMLEHLGRQGVTGRLELVLVDRWVTAAAACTLGRHHDVEVRRVGWDDKQPVFAPSGTPGASKSPMVAWAAPGAWRSRSRTPSPRRRDGFRSPASRLRCATCQTNGLAGAESRVAAWASMNGAGMRQARVLSRPWGSAARQP